MYKVYFICINTKYFQDRERQRMLYSPQFTMQMFMCGWSRLGMLCCQLMWQWRWENDSIVTDLWQACDISLLDVTKICSVILYTQAWGICCLLLTRTCPRFIECVCITCHRILWDSTSESHNIVRLPRLSDLKVHFVTRKSLTFACFFHPHCQYSHGKEFLKLAGYTGTAKANDTCTWHPYYRCPPSDLDAHEVNVSCASNKI